MGQKMGKAPVYYTVAQVRFNPVLSFDTYLPTIQESLRKAGYPDFERRVGVVFKVRANANSEGSSGAVQQIHQAQQIQYVFSNMESTRGFVLNQDSLVIQATEYDVFETFSSELLRLLDLLNKTVALSYTDRVGVRYLDAVVPGKGEDLPDYLVPQMLGLYGKLEGDLVHAFCETMTRVKSDVIMSRVVIQQGQLSFPADLQPVGLVVAERFAKINGLHAMLDTDGFFEGREPFDIASLKGKLFELHDEIVKSFRATVTPHALAAWK